MPVVAALVGSVQMRYETLLRFWNSKSHAGRLIVCFYLQDAESDLGMDGGEGDPMGEEVDSTLYCLCRRVSYGEMIGCDNGECPIEWFHLGCVGLTATNRPRGKWYCPECRFYDGPEDIEGDFKRASLNPPRKGKYPNLTPSCSLVWRCQARVPMCSYHWCESTHRRGCSTHAAKQTSGNTKQCHTTACNILSRVIQHCPSSTRRCTYANTVCCAVWIDGNANEKCHAATTIRQQETMSSLCDYILLQIAIVGKAWGTIMTASLHAKGIFFPL
jgi:hypothetical protein